MGSEVKQSEPFSKNLLQAFCQKSHRYFCFSNSFTDLNAFIHHYWHSYKDRFRRTGYLQTKEGWQRRKRFYIYKFRTMYLNADKIGPTITREGDSRITRVGKVLRKFSIDELPQMLNVLLGQMSLVGYRPGVRENYSESDLKSKIFDLKPGITGYAQVMEEAC